MTRNQRGSVMVHVLITSAIMGMLAAGMMGIVLMQYRLVHREAYGSRGEKYDEMALALITSYWSAAQTKCANMTPSTGDVSYSCTGTPGVCSCVCSPTPSGFYPTVTAQIDLATGECALTAAWELNVP